MNSPSGPSKKRDHGDHRSYERPVDQTARSEQMIYTNNTPRMPVNAASITAANPQDPWGRPQSNGVLLYSQNSSVVASESDDV